jgi:2-hydroxychromene-2-carboxylate isomerase
MADIEFFWDPVCPWAWLTSRWVVEVAALRSLEVEWRFICLRMVNAGRDYATEFRPGHERGHTRGLELLRVAAAVDAAHGPAAVGALYTELGRAFHVEHRAAEFDDPARTSTRTALEAAGLPSSLADAAGDSAWDERVAADTQTALARTGKDVGTPIITFGPPDGPSFFGPVISRVPRGADAERLWDAVETLARQPGFSELKRSHRERPQLQG